MRLLSRLKGRYEKSRKIALAKREYEARKAELFKIYLERNGDIFEKMEALERERAVALGHPRFPSNIPRHFWQRDHDQSGDFRPYYRHIRTVSLIFTIFNLTLWSFPFFFGGNNISVRIFIGLMALTITSGNALQLLYMARVEKHIIRPVEILSAAATRVARGDFTVRVETGGTSVIGRLAAAFNGMVVALAKDQELAAQYERDRKALIANISHDLKTPITAIQGYVEAMEDDRLDDPDRKKRYFTLVCANASYMNKLIDDLFLFSRLDMRKLDFVFSEIELKPFMCDLVEELGLDIAEAEAEFTYEDNIAEGKRARLDVKRFHQVLHNILDNAIHHGPETGLAVSVEAATNESLLVMTVTDNGPGIPPDKLGHLFERFYRIESARTKNLSSTGLGLAIAKELVEAHGGNLSATNAESGGAVFRIELPLLTEEV